MAKMLMATWDGAGNFPPERALLRLLVGRGHTVSVLCHDHQRAEVEADGAMFLPYAGIEQVKATDFHTPTPRCSKRWSSPRA